MGDLNISAVKKYALRCSKEKRGGRFTRIGQDFLDELAGEVEAIVRDLRHTRFSIPADEALATEENFVVGPLAEKLREALNQAVARIIQKKIQSQPSVGVTAGRTR